MHEACRLTLAPEAIRFALQFNVIDWKVDTSRDRGCVTSPEGFLGGSRQKKQWHSPHGN
jgi:hypothetical protein